MGMSKYRSWIERHPSLHYLEIVDSNLWKLAEAFGQSDGVDFISLTKQYVIDSSREMIPQYIAASLNADVLFGSHSAMLELQHLTVAQAVQKPIVFLTHDLTLPTAEYSFDAGTSRVQDYGRRVNVFNQRIFGIVLGAALTFGAKADMREVRTNLGLSTPWPFMQVLSPETLADYPVLETRDPTLWPIPKDGPSHWHNTGYFMTLDKGRERPSTQDDVQEWIDGRKANGRKLIYFGQGSFSHHAQEVFTDILYQTLTDLDVDAIALSSTVDDRPHSPDHMKLVDDLDQVSTFPQCEVIVHHGGAGSASQSIRSGRPGITVPSMPFQEIWGAKIEEFGAGKLLRPSDMVAAWEQNKTNLLTLAVRAVMEEDVRYKAIELGRLAREASDTRGVTFGADVIIDYLQDVVKRKANDHVGGEGNEL